MTIWFSIKMRFYKDHATALRLKLIKKISFLSLLISIELNENFNELLEILYKLRLKNFRSLKF